MKPTEMTTKELATLVLSIMETANQTHDTAHFSPKINFAKKINYLFFNTPYQTYMDAQDTGLSSALSDILREIINKKGK
jgi:hypothetical protein